MEAEYAFIFTKRHTNSKILSVKLYSDLPKPLPVIREQAESGFLKAYINHSLQANLFQDMKFETNHVKFM